MVIRLVVIKRIVNSRPLGAMHEEAKVVHTAMRGVAFFLFHSTTFEWF